MYAIRSYYARIERFRRLLTAEKSAVLDRIFTAGEKAYALAKKDLV